MVSSAQQAKQIFLKLADRVPAEDWDACLDDECLGDVALKGRVQALLEAHANPKSGLDGPLDITRLEENESQSSAVGQQIGPYKLLEVIGEGGMGTVYMASQTEPIRRRVAVKVIKTGMDTRQVIARFEAERQTLALMDHPNISKVLDAGSTDSGRPYFVMELVKGIPVTKFCDKQQMGLNERLELFQQVCHAVQHAHQKGIIHRDIKPSNVLVAMYDDRPVVKVIDFGVAKATGDQLTEKTMFTRFGQVVGTLEYMSPEQAQFNQLDIDTRSDIYSLGAIFCELISGEPPFNKQRLKSQALDETLRMIREEEPTKPSTKLSSAGQLAQVASNRSTTAERLGSQLRGDLDWIVMRALDKDRSRRYETANGLAMDIERYLKDKPVVAGPPTAGYRFRKFVSRNMVGLAFAATVFGFFLVGTVALTISNHRLAKTQRKTFNALSLADREFENARIAEEDARQNWLRAEQREQEAVEAIRQFGDAVANNPDLRNRSELESLRTTLLQEPISFFSKLRERISAEANGPESLAQLAEAVLDLGKLNELLGDKQDAMRSYREAWQAYEALAAEIPKELKFQRGLAISQFHFGEMQFATGDKKEAISTLRQAVQIQRQVVKNGAQNSDDQSQLALMHHSIGQILHGFGDEEAEAEFQQALDIQKHVVDLFPGNPEYQSRLAHILYNFAFLLDDIGREGEATNLLHETLVIRERLVRDHGTVSDYLLDLATTYHFFGTRNFERKANDAALKYFQRSAEIQERIINNQPSVTEYQDKLAVSYLNMGTAFGSLGKVKEALNSFGRAKEISEQLARKNPHVPKYQSLARVLLLNMATLDMQARNFSEAREKILAAIESGKRILAIFPDRLSSRFWLLSSYESLLVLAIELEDDTLFAEARRGFAQVSLSPDDEAFSRHDAGSMNNFYFHLVIQSAPIEIRSITPDDLVALRRMVERFPSGAFYNTLGVAEYRLTNYEAAISACSKSVELLPKQLNLPGPSPVDLAVLAMSHHKLGQGNEANSFRAQFKKAMQIASFKNDRDNQRIAKELEQMFSD